MLILKFAKIHEGLNFLVFYFKYEMKLVVI